MLHKLHHNGCRIYNLPVINRGCHGGLAPSIFSMMDRGPARLAKYLEDGLRPVPTHHKFNIYGSDRPDPPIVQVSRPGPAHDIDSEAHETQALYGPARHFYGAARGLDGPVHGPAHVLSNTKSCMLACFLKD